MTNWRGKAHNSKAVEPDAHEKFSFGGDPKPVIDAYRRVRAEDRAKQPEKYTYEMVKEARARGNGSSMSIGHYAYEMMYDVYTGIEDELVENSIDTHLRIYPDYVPRSVNIIEHAINCSKAKMRAIVSVDHFFPTIGQAWAAQEWVDDMVRKGELEQACRVLGVHMLAWSHHPDQINLIRKYPAIGGGVMFWTQSGGGKNCGPELHIVDAKGRLDSEVKECIRL